MSTLRHAEFPVESTLPFDALRQAVEALRALPGVIFSEYYPQHHQVVLEYDEDIMTFRRVEHALRAKGITPIVSWFARALHELMSPPDSET